MPAYIKPLKHLGTNTFVFSYEDYRRILSMDTSENYKYSWHDVSTKSCKIVFGETLPNFVDKTSLDPKYAPDKEDEWV